LKEVGTTEIEQSSCTSAPVLSREEEGTINIHSSVVAVSGARSISGSAELVAADRVLFKHELWLVPLSRGSILYLLPIPGSAESSTGCLIKFRILAKTQSSIDKQPPAFPSFLCSD
jgi:hypothetical protein